MSGRIRGGRGFALLAGLLVLASVGIGGVAAANAAVNYNASAAQQQSYRGQVSIAKYQMNWSGIQYENNQGQVTKFAGSVNQSARNPIGYSPTKMAVPDFSKFPHSQSGVSALNASQWTANGTSTVQNVKPANGVPGVRLSLTQGNRTTFSNFSITSNENKKTLMAAFNVNSLTAGSTIQLRINDTDGDYKMATINTSRSAGADYMANATGHGYVFQKQLGKLKTHTTNGSDGTFNNIQSVEVVPKSGSGSITLTALNLDKTGRYVFGTQNASGTTQTVYQKKTPGKLQITGLGSLDSAFSGATLHGLSVNFVRKASSLPAGDVNASYTNAKAYPSFKSSLDLQYRMSLPTGYDLTYKHLRLTATQALPSSRYAKLGTVAGAGNTSFSQVAYTDRSGKLGSQGKRIILDSTIQPSQTEDVRWQYLVTSSEQTSLQQTGAAGVIGGGGGGGGGGIMSMIMSWPGMLTAAVLGFFGARRAGML